jgi:hypothetical protein
MARSCDFINALDLLTEQHAEVDRLFKLIESKRGNRRAAIVELVDKLAAHATIEEKLFYPCIMSEETSKLLHESVEAHLGIKRMLADRLTMDLDASELDAKIAVLKEQVLHHAHEEEEAKLFPTVRKTMNFNELAVLGNELIVMFEHLMEADLGKLAPDQTIEAAYLLA